MKSAWNVSGYELAKAFNRRTIFRGVSFSVSSGQSLIITGPNGSGKSTLVKIIARVLTPTSGTVNITTEVRGSAVPCQVGLVSPYIQMFEEFTAMENLKLCMGIRGLDFHAYAAGELLERVKLHPRRDDPVRTYSSGMKQRLKYAFALLPRPPLLILDEPMANLDDDGVAIVRAIMSEHQTTGVLVVATNDQHDLDAYDGRVDLHDSR
jgi:heme exporter protein A